MELEIKIDDDKEVEMKQMEVMKNLSDENMELKKKIEWIEKDVKEKEKEIEELKGLNQALLVKEKLINDELEDACKVFISVSLFPSNCNFKICISILIKHKKVSDLSCICFTVLPSSCYYKINNYHFIPVLKQGMREIFDPPAQKKEQKCNLKRGC